MAKKGSPSKSSICEATAPPVAALVEPEDKNTAEIPSSTANVSPPKRKTHRGGKKQKKKKMPKVGECCVSSLRTNLGDGECDVSSLESHPKLDGTASESGKEKGKETRVPLVIPSVSNVPTEQKPGEGSGNPDDPSGNDAKCGRGADECVAPISPQRTPENVSAQGERPDSRDDPQDPKGLPSSLSEVLLSCEVPVHGPPDPLKLISEQRGIFEAAVLKMRLSATNAERLRAVVTSLADLCTQQSCQLAAASARLSERRELATQLQAMRPKPTYAKVAAAAPAALAREGAAKAPKREDKNIVLVYPTAPGASSESLKGVLRQHLDPIRLGLGIRNVRKVSKGGLLVECQQKSGVEKVLQHVASVPALKESVAVRTPVTRRPSVIIYDVDSTIERKSVVPALIKQNDLGNLQEGSLELRFPLRGKKGTNNWVLSADPQVFKTLLAKKRLNLGWGRCGVKEYLHIRRCFKCYGFGHFSRDCKEPCQLCSKCGNNHSFRECKATGGDLKCCNCIKANAKFGLGHAVNHGAMDDACPCFTREVVRAHDRTRYESAGAVPSTPSQGPKK